MLNFNTNCNFEIEKWSLRFFFERNKFESRKLVLKRGRPVEPRSALVKNRGVRGQFQSWFETPFSRTYMSKAQNSFRLIFDLSKIFDKVEKSEFWMNFEVWCVIKAIILTSNMAMWSVITLFLDRIWNRSTQIGQIAPQLRLRGCLSENFIMEKRNFKKFY